MFQPQELSGYGIHTGNRSPLPSRSGLKLHISVFPAQCSNHWATDKALYRSISSPSFEAAPMDSQGKHIWGQRKESRPEGTELKV